MMKYVKIAHGISSLDNGGLPLNSPVVIYKKPTTKTAAQSNMFFIISSFFLYASIIYLYKSNKQCYKTKKNQPVRTDPNLPPRCWHSVGDSSFNNKATAKKKRCGFVFYRGAALTCRIFSSLPHALVLIFRILLVPSPRCYHRGWHSICKQIHSTRRRSEEVLQCQSVSWTRGG